MDTEEKRVGHHATIMDSDLISVNVVAYNAERTISRTLESILAQREVSLEIIVVDDASTDLTCSLLETAKSCHPHVRWRVIRNDVNLGVSRSRNRALEVSAGKYLAVLDSDDTWTSEFKLRDQLAYLKANPGCVVVGTQMIRVSLGGMSHRPTSYPLDDAHIRRWIIVFNRFCHSSILMRNVGVRYDESLCIWEDYDLLLKLGTLGTYANLDLALVEYSYVPRKYSFRRRIKHVLAELKIASRYQAEYKNFWLGRLVRAAKTLLVVLRIK